MRESKKIKELLSKLNAVNKAKPSFGTRVLNWLLILIGVAWSLLFIAMLVKWLF